jgi:hypothetical protein
MKNKNKNKLILKNTMNIKRKSNIRSIKNTSNITNIIIMSIRNITMNIIIKRIINTTEDTKRINNNGAKSNILKTMKITKKNPNKKAMDLLRSKTR